MKVNYHGENKSYQDLFGDSKYEKRMSKNSLKTNMLHNMSLKYRYLIKILLWDQCEFSYSELI